MLPFKDSATHSGGDMLSVIVPNQIEESDVPKKS